MPPWQFLNICFNIILPSPPGSSKCPPSLRFYHRNPVCTSPPPHTTCIHCPSHFSWFDQLNNICWRVYRAWNVSLCSLLYSPVTSSLLGPNILLSTLFLNTLGLYSSPQVLHPHKETAKIKISFNNIIEILARGWINAAKFYLLMFYLYVFRPGYVITKQFCKVRQHTLVYLHMSLMMTQGRRNLL